MNGKLQKNGDETYTRFAGTYEKTKQEPEVAGDTKTTANSKPPKHEGRPYRVQTALFFEV